MIKKNIALACAILLLF